MALFRLSVGLNEVWGGLILPWTRVSVCLSHSLLETPFPYVYSRPLVSVGDQFQDPPRIPHSVDAQVPYIGGPQPLGHRPGLVCGLLGTGPRSRKWVVGERASELHPYLQLHPIARITAWAPPPVRSVVALDSQRSTNPTVNCACEGSRLHAP